MKSDEMTSIAKLLLIGLISWLCGSQPALGCWKEPEVVLMFPTPEVRPGKFLGVDADGAFVFDNLTIKIVNGNVIMTPLPQPAFLRETPTPVIGPSFWREAILGDSCKSYKNHGVLTCDGRIERLTEWIGVSFFCSLPGGGFLMKETHESPTKRIEKVCEDAPQFFARYRFYEFDSAGRYVKELTKPPKNFSIMFKSDMCSQRTGKDVPTRIVFPDKECALTDTSFLKDRRPSMFFRTITGFGWVAESGDYLYAFDHQGRVICESKTMNREPFAWLGLAKLESEIRKRDGENPPTPRNSSGFDKVRWDSKGNAFVLLETTKGYYLLKMPWVDEDVQPLSKPAEITPLDGWGRPLPENPGPPSKTLQDRGDILTFHYPEQVLPLENGLFPVYSLWDYQLSAFQRDNPAAIRGAVAGAGYNTPALMMYVPDFAPQISLDVNSLAADGCITVSTPHPKAKPQKIFWRDLEQARKGTLSYDPKKFDMRFGCFGPREKEYAECPASLTIMNSGKSVLSLDPTAPDMLQLTNVFVEGPLEIYDGKATMIETGPDTKVFVAPTVMTRAWIEPRNLPPAERATMKAYSKNWVNGKEDNVVLKETTPGSRKFASQDGSVIYELTHVLDEEGRAVPAPSPGILDRLYLYLTDPALGLSHQPQLLYENGIDTGEYWSYGEPTNASINRGFMKAWSYKHWWQVSEEMEKAKFTVEASGPSVSEGSVFRVLWDDPDGKTQHYDIPLIKGADGKFKTTTPLLCFEVQGCDIGGTWSWTDKVATPQIPGAVAVRSNNLRLVVYSPEDLQEEALNSKR